MNGEKLVLIRDWRYFTLLFNLENRNVLLSKMKEFHVLLIIYEQKKRS